MKTLITVTVIGIWALTAGFSQPVPSKIADNEIIIASPGGGGIGGNRYIRS